jgi:DNA-binding MarR family transcriptional regulator/N-acetylglutamate synthase-like GNAT family acetyltransferase
MEMPSQRIEAVRRFNRFYTRRIGVLKPGLLNSPFSLAEGRILYELAHREKSTASELCRELELDPGYVSRILRGFKKRNLVAGTPSKSDGRQSFLSLTDEGAKAFEALNARSQDEVRAMLDDLSDAQQRQVVDAIETMERILGAEPISNKAPYLLRTHQAGDMGWIVHRHGLLYAQEYGWDERFEALVADIVAKFVQHFDPKRERCWVAEKDGEIVGSVFLVKQSKTVAKLRLLLVEPKARGLGIGGRLVNECIRFARQTGYRKITLWTNSVLQAARHIYQQAGFRLVQEESHHSFGYDLVSQTWELTL